MSTQRETVIVSIIITVFCLCGISFFTPAKVSTGTVYSAVTLNNGNTLYGRLSGLGNSYPVLQDVFTLERKADAEGHESFVLTPRLNEWHAPKSTIINARHIVLVEPVAAYSRLGKLISRRSP